MPYTRPHDVPYSRAGTSEAAARSQDKSVRTVREQVYRHIATSKQRGFTCEEIEQLMNLRHQTASARIRDLAMAGRLKDSGARRITSSKRQAIVWVTL